MYNELHQILQYITDSLKKYNLDGLYSQLAQLYEQARTAPSEAVTKSIEDLNNQILEVQDKLQPTNFDNLSVRVFNNFDKNGLLGKRGIDNTVAGLSGLSLDPHGASVFLQGWANQITELRTRANVALENLGGVFEEPEAVPDGMEKLQIVFEGEVSVETFDDLEGQSKEWEEILKIASQIFPDGYEKPKLWSIHKGSPVIIVIVAPVCLVVTLGTAVKYVLDIIQKMLDIRKVQLEIEKLELEKAQEIKTQLEEEERKKLESHIDAATQKLIEEYKSQIGEKHINVAHGAAKIVISKMYNFAVSGGQVNLVDGKRADEENGTEQGNDLNTLIERFSQIRKEEKALNSPKFLHAGVSSSDIQQLIKKKQESPKKTTVRNKRTVKKNEQKNTVTQPHEATLSDNEDQSVAEDANNKEQDKR